MRWILLVGLFGCLRAHYRYVDVPLPPEPAKAEIARESAADGITVDAPPCTAVYCEPDRYQLRRGVQWSSIDVESHGGGSRVELVDWSAEPILLPPVLATRPIHEIRVNPHEPGWSDYIVTDWELSGSVESDPRIGLGWRSNAAGQVGARVARWGALGDSARPGYSMAILAGGGMKLSSTGPALMPELTLSFDRQALVEPIAGEHLPVGPRDAIDLTLAGLVLDDEHDSGGKRVSSRNGVELGVTARRVGIGGITARVGYLWGPGGGRTASIGVRALDPWHACVVTLGVAALYAIVLVVSHPDPVEPSHG